MAGTSWLVDKSRIATKIKSASGACDPDKVIWKSNPTRACPSCQHIIDNSDVAQEWPGLPKGVKFDPSDQDIICHLLAKVGVGNSRSHPFIDEFITSLEVDDGICYTHPKHLPGVNQDGSASHFFHRAIKAYNTGNRKRRKILGQDFSDVRWHKTGRTKPVMLNGLQKGCKKILVLYMSKGGKAEKTNWVMHQYHLGTQEDEKEGEYVVSKIFYQQQHVKSGDKDDLDIPASTLGIPESTENIEATAAQVHPVTPKSVTPDPPCNKRPHSNVDVGLESHFIPQHPSADCVEDVSQAGEEPKTDIPKEEAQICDEGIDNDEDDDANEEQKWWESESQHLLNSQQLVEALSLCEDLLHSQSPNRDDKSEEHKDRPSLSVYAQLGPEHLKKDLEECQNLAIDPANIELDTPPEFRLSQLEFGSQDSYIAWGGSKEEN